MSQPVRFDLITFLLHGYLVCASTFATLTFNGNHLITFTSDMEHWIWKSGKTKAYLRTGREQEVEVPNRNSIFYDIIIFHVNRSCRSCSSRSNCWCLCCCCYFCVSVSFMIYGNRMHEMREQQQQQQQLTKGKNSLGHNPFFFLDSLLITWGFKANFLS